MKQYFDTAKGTAVHHGLKALKETLGCSKDCTAFAVALQNAMAPAPVTSAPPKEQKDKEKDHKGTENTRAPRAVAVKAALEGVKSSPTDSMPKVAVADVVIRKVLPCAADRKKLCVHLLGNTINMVNYTLACGAPSLYHAAVIVKSAPKSFDKLTLPEFNEFVSTKLAEIYSAVDALAPLVKRLLADDAISDAAKDTISAAVSSITEMSFGVVTSVCRHYKSLVAGFLKKLQKVLESEPLNGLEDSVEKKDLNLAADQSELLCLVKTQEAKDVNNLWKDVGGGAGGRRSPRGNWGTRWQSLLSLWTGGARARDLL